MALLTYSDNVELLSYGEDDSEPDEPLPFHESVDTMAQNTPAFTSRMPKWLTHQHTKGSLQSVRHYILALIRPRFTWKYTLFTILFLYVGYCIIRGSPLLASKLPKYSGRHEVGTIDLEIVLESPRIISNETVLKKTGIQPFELQTVLFSIYYPATKGTGLRKKHPWIPKPISLRAEGYANLGHVNNFVIRPILTFALWAIAGSIEIPAVVDAKLYGSDESLKEKYPVMVFSHGFASSRTDYTHYCGELAARGHVVAILEHRDGSSAGSYVVKDGVRIRKVVSFSEKDLLSDPPMDTPKLKYEQLALRTAEIEETIAIMKRIDSGEGQKIYETSAGGEGSFLQAWQGRLDFEQLTIAGHSYGATGALQALKGAPSKENVAIGGIILDPGKSSGPLNNDVNVPILVVHSNSWSSKHSIFFGRPHFDTVKDLVSGVMKKVGASWFVTSLGTSHPSVTDAPLIEPWLLSFTTGATINVNEGLREYVKISLDFFEYLQKGIKQGILAEKVTHPQYNQWISEERKREFPDDMAKYWEIHVSPN